MYKGSNVVHFSSFVVLTMIPFKKNIRLYENLTDRLDLLTSVLKPWRQKTDKAGENDKTLSVWSQGSDADGK